MVEAGFPHAVLSQWPVHRPTVLLGSCSYMFDLPPC